MIGVPMILVSTVLVPAPHGGLAWRGLDSGVYPWMPAIPALMWGFTIISCTVISWVIYGLRAEVREARRFGQYAWRCDVRARAQQGRHDHGDAALHSPRDGDRAG